MSGDLNLVRQAAENSTVVWDQKTLAGLALERGMPEGLTLAEEVLRSEQGGEFLKRDIASEVRKYTGVFRSHEQLAEWLDHNAGNLVWNAETRVFEP